MLPTFCAQNRSFHQSREDGVEEVGERVTTKTIKPSPKRNTNTHRSTPLPCTCEPPPSSHPRRRNSDNSAKNPSKPCEPTLIVHASPHRSQDRSKSPTRTGTPQAVTSKSSSLRGKRSATPFSLKLHFKLYYFGRLNRVRSRPRFCVWFGPGGSFVERLAEGCSYTVHSCE